MSDNWFYAKNGQTIGPVTLDVLRNQLACGAIQPQDLVWRKGMAQWAPANTVGELGGTSNVAVATLINAPSSPLDYQTSSFDPEYAGFWRRFCAAFLDGIITSIAGAIIGFIIGMVVGVGMGAGGGNARAAGAVSEGIGNILGIVVGWLYAASMESSAKQATFGKMAMGIMVTDIYGQRISFARASGRHFGKILSVLTLFVGYLMVAFTERKQGLHDKMANCLVIRSAR